MFEKTVADPTEIENAIDRLLEHMTTKAPDSDEYAQTVDQLVKIHALKEAEKPKSMSPDVKATIIANLVGIGAILWHERAGIVTSKALSFVTKLR